MPMSRRKQCAYGPHACKSQRYDVLIRALALTGGGGEGGA